MGVSPKSQYSDGLSFPLWLRQTKVSPNSHQGNILQRPALLRKLNGYKERVLTLLEAPAGFGKSTVLTSWKNSLDKNTARVCWISVDEDDNDEFRLLNYLAFSFVNGGASFDDAGIKEAQFFDEVSPQNRISIITNIVNASDHDYVLILDDFENLRRPIVEAIIQPLINFCPPNLHIVISTRYAGNLKISNLEMSNNLTSITSAELRFTITDIKELCRNQQSSTTIQELYGVTQGWPALVFLIYMRLIESNDSTSFENVIKSSTNSLLNYLSEQILAGIESGLQQFLLEISLFEVVDIKLADFVRDAGDSLKWFSRADTLTIMLHPIEDSTDSYRFHPLIRELLYKQLQRSDPERFHNLHSRAARWFLDNDDLIVAINHCVTVNNIELAIEIFEEVGPVGLWLKEGFRRIKLIVNLIGVKALSRSPRISLVLCVLDIMSGNPHISRDRFLGLCKVFEASKASMKQFEVDTFIDESSMIDSFITCFEGEADSSSILKLLTERAIDTEKKEHMVLGFDFAMVSFAYSTCGLFDQALSYAIKAKFHLSKCDARYGEVHVDYHIGNIYFALGDHKNAEEYLAESAKIARQYFWDDKSLKLILTIFVAETQYENNQLEDIPRSFMKTSAQLESSQAWIDLYVSGYTVSSNLESHYFGYREADQILSRGMNRAKSENFRALWTFLLFQKCLLALRAGKGSEARKLLDQSGLTLSVFTSHNANNYVNKVRDAAIFAFNRLAIEESDYANVIADLTSVEGTFTHIRSRIYCCMLLAAAYCGNGQTNNAIASMSQALEFSAEHKLTRIILDDFSLVKTVLSDFCSTNDMKISNRLIRHAKYLHKLKLDSQKCQGDSAVVLSNRELEVLELLAIDYSNKLIARELYVSDNTVRFHLKNIFSKLHVNTRKKAVDVAIDRKILLPKKSPPN